MPNARPSFTARRRRFAAAAALGAGLLLTGCSATGQQDDTSAPDAAPEAAAAAAAASDVVRQIAQAGVVTLDVRTPEEFAAGHVQDAQNIDVSADDFRSRVNALPRQGAYVVYCRTGNRSAAAAEIMQELGFTQVTDAGALDDLLAAGAPPAA